MRTIPTSELIAAIRTALASDRLLATKGSFGTLWRDDLDCGCALGCALLRPEIEAARAAHINSAQMLNGLEIVYFENPQLACELSFAHDRWGMLVHDGLLDAAADARAKFVALLEESR